MKKILLLITITIIMAACVLESGEEPIDSNEPLPKSVIVDQIPVDSVQVPIDTVVADPVLDTTIITCSPMGDKMYQTFDVTLEHIKPVPEATATCPVNMRRQFNQFTKQRDCMLSVTTDGVVTEILQKVIVDPEPYRCDIHHEAPILPSCLKQVTNCVVCQEFTYKEPVINCLEIY